MADTTQASLPSYRQGAGDAVRVHAMQPERAVQAAVVAAPEPIVDQAPAASQPQVDASTQESAVSQPVQTVPQQPDSTGAEEAPVAAAPATPVPVSPPEQLAAQPTPVSAPTAVAPEMPASASVSAQPAASVQPAQVSVSGSKEQAPIVMQPKEEEDDEKPVVVPQEQVVTASIPEVVVPKEVEQHVEHGPDATEHQLDETVKQAGVSLTKEATPVITEPTLPFALPMNYEDAKSIRKTAKMKEAIKWVAALVLYNLKKVNPKVYK